MEFCWRFCCLGKTSSWAAGFILVSFLFFFLLCCRRCVCGGNNCEKLRDENIFVLFTGCGNAACSRPKTLCLLFDCASAGDRREGGRGGLAACAVDGGFYGYRRGCPAGTCVPDA